MERSTRANPIIDSLRDEFDVYDEHEFAVMRVFHRSLNPHGDTPKPADSGECGRACAILEGVRRECLELLRPTLAHYLWHRDSFHLQLHCPHSPPSPSASSDHTRVPHLFAKICFGDGIDDEWFLAHLALSLSHAFADLCISVRDNDGEFLFIEAAAVLPAHVRPTSSLNTLWIHRGRLLLLHPRTPAHLLRLSSPPTLLQALAAIFSLPAPPADQLPPQHADACETAIAQPIVAMEHVIHERIRRVVHSLRRRGQLPAPPNAPSPPPDIISSTAPAMCALYSVRCVVPLPVALLLAARPHWVAHAVRVFYYRDALDARCLRRMEAYRPTKARSVTTVVEMTRCMFAQLASQQFTSPRMKGCTEPLFTLPARSEATFRAHDIGMKLTCGFEMLRHAALKRRVEDAMPWEPTAVAMDDVVRRMMGTEDESALVAEWSEALSVKLRSRVGPSGYFECVGGVEQEEETDEEWLNVTPEDLEDELTQRWRNVEKEGASPYEELHKMVQSIQGFLNEESGLDGIGGGGRGGAGDGSDTDEEFYDVGGDDSENEADEKEEAMRAYMQQMDAELRGMAGGPGAAEGADAGMDSELSVEEREELEMLHNLLEGMKAEGGANGPFRSLMSMLQ